jgi:hypothetical protein
MRFEKQNIYFASDYHVGHHNVIRFDGRPFGSVEEMHETLIKNWNSVVQDKDIVFYLGDFAFKDKGEAKWFRDQLKGKIYFIMGNHDEMDLGQSGISVLFKTQKNRLAKPKKIRFDISFATGLYKYSGLENFCRPEYFSQIGIAQGKMEVDKKTGEMTFTPGGNRWYINHLNKSVTTKQLFTQEIFTIEVLEKMAPIVNDYFRFKSLDEIEQVEKEFNNIIEEEDNILDSDDFDAGEFFN